MVRAVQKSIRKTSKISWKINRKSDAQIFEKSLEIDEKWSQNPSNNHKKMRSKKWCKNEAQKAPAPNPRQTP